MPPNAHETGSCRITPRARGLRSHCVDFPPADCSKRRFARRSSALEAERRGSWPEALVGTALSSDTHGACFHVQVGPTMQKWCWLKDCHTIPCHAMPRHVVSCHIMSCHFISFHTPNLPTNIISTKICWLIISGKLSMDMRIPSLIINIMLE